MNISKSMLFHEISTFNTYVYPLRTLSITCC